MLTISRWIAQIINPVTDKDETNYNVSVNTNNSMTDTRHNWRTVMKLVHYLDDLTGHVDATDVRPVSGINNQQL